MRVLIVEDNFLISILLEDGVSDAGHDVVGACGSSAEALAVARAADQVDLALVDIDLDDGRTGVVLAEQLRDELGIPCIFATGQGEVARANPSAAMAVLDKPFSASDVAGTLLAAGYLLKGEAPPSRPRNLHMLSASQFLARNEGGASQAEGPSPAP